MIESVWLCACMHVCVLLLGNSCCVCCKRGSRPPKGRRAA